MTLTCSCRRLAASGGVAGEGWHTGGPVDNGGAKAMTIRPTLRQSQPQPQPPLTPLRSRAHPVIQPSHIIDVDGAAAAQEEESLFTPPRPSQSQSGIKLALPGSPSCPPIILPRTPSPLSTPRPTATSTRTAQANVNHLQRVDVPAQWVIGRDTNVHTTANVPLPVPGFPGNQMQMQASLALVAAAAAARSWPLVASLGGMPLPSSAPTAPSHVPASTGTPSPWPTAIRGPAVYSAHGQALALPDSTPTPIHVPGNTGAPWTTARGPAMYYYAHDQAQASGGQRQYLSPIAATGMNSPGPSSSGYESDMSSTVTRPAKRQRVSESGAYVYATPSPVPIATSSSTSTIISRSRLGAGVNAWGPPPSSRIEYRGDFIQVLRDNDGCWSSKFNRSGSYEMIKSPR
jgi:hypothetical protein